MENKNELLDKYNISEQDLYTLGIIEARKDSVGFFEKDKLKAKSLGVLKPYNVKFMDLGNLLNAIKTQGYHKDQSLIDKYGHIDLESKTSSLGMKYVIPGMKYVIPIIVGIVVFFYIFSSIVEGTTFPDEWRDRKLYSVSDSRDWIIIRSDDSFTLHEYIPNSEQTFEWNGKIDGMTLVSSKPFSYHGRNNYKPTQIDPNIEVMDISGKFLRINFEGFNTISGSYQTDGRNYVP
jgi:hypothetical protein